MAPFIYKEGLSRRRCYPLCRNSWTQMIRSSSWLLVSHSTVPADRHLTKSKQLSRMAIFRMTSTFSGWSQWGPISLLKDVAHLPKHIWRPVVTVRIPVATLKSRHSCPDSTTVRLLDPLVPKSTALEPKKLLKRCRHILLLILTNFIRLPQIDTQSTTLHRHHFQLDEYLKHIFNDFSCFSHCSFRSSSDSLPLFASTIVLPYYKFSSFVPSPHDIQDQTAHGSQICEIINTSPNETPGMTYQIICFLHRSLNRLLTPFQPLHPPIALLPATLTVSSACNLWVLFLLQPFHPIGLTTLHLPLDFSRPLFCIDALLSTTWSASGTYA
jgi:hypothetical protein